MLQDEFIRNESFKRPIPPEMRPPFPQHLYSMYQPQIPMPNSSAFYRPDGRVLSKSGIPVSLLQHLALDDDALKSYYHSQMSGFVPNLSNLELIRQAGIFYPRISDLTGELQQTNFF